MSTNDESLGWKITRRILVCLAGLLTLTALFYAVENQRGKSSWLKFKRQWEAKGEKFDLQSLRAAPVPDEQNFAMTPVLARLLDYTYDAARRHAEWRDTNTMKQLPKLADLVGTRGQPTLGKAETATLTDLTGWFYALSQSNQTATPSVPDEARGILTALSRYDTNLNELAIASKRPYAVFPVHYEEGFFTLLPHLAVLKSYAQILQLRTVAHLETGAIDRALADTQLILRLGESLKPERFLISQLVRCALHEIASSTIWEGIARRRWNVAALRELQTAVEKIDLLEDFAPAMRGERALINEFLDKDRRLELLSGDSTPPEGEPAWGHWFKLVPRGWIHQNQLVINRLYQEKALPLIDVKARRVFPHREIDDEFDKTTPYNFVAHLVFPALSKSSQKFAYSQTLIDQARCACAVERFYAENGKYPTALADLQPKFLASIPSDVIDGQPLRYRIVPAGTEGDKDSAATAQVVLYSIGWNQSDDRGQVVMSKAGKRRQSNDGDWVWQHPGPEKGK
jgi:hypothetical protein